MPDAYPEQLDRFLEILLRRQSTVEGGWGARLDLKNTSLSIVTTVQALRVLRAVRTPYEHPAVEAGLAYVAGKVLLHPWKQTPERPEARGHFTRFCAFGLLGLTTWDEGRHDARLFNAQRFCVEWLKQNELDYGGWADAPPPLDEPTISLTATSPAIRGLIRVCPHLNVAATAAELAHRARKAVERTAQGHVTQRWWAQDPSYPDSSPASTALAVLALAGGDADQQDAAAAGAAWLMRHVGEWAARVELDERIPNRQWTHMSFSLALRAVVGPAGRVDPADPRLKPAIEHLYRLWSDEHGAWVNGRPGRPPTTSGSQAVVSAIETLRRHARFDPLIDLRRRRLRPALPPPGPSESRPHLLKLQGTQGLLVESDGTVFATFTPTVRQRELLEILVERHRAGAAARELRARTVPAKDLAAHFGGIKEDSVRKSADRLNQVVRDAQGRTVRVQALVEDREADGEPGVTRWGITLDVASDEPADASGASPVS